MPEVRRPQSPSVTGTTATPATPAADARKPIVPTPTPTSPDAPTTTAGDRPTAASSRGGQRVGIPGLAVAQGLANNPKSKVSAFELIPGRYSDAISLPTLLKKMGSSPEGQGVIKNVVAQYEAQTGIPVPPALLATIVAKPERMLDLLAARPDQLAAGVDAVNAAYKAGQVKDLPPMSRLLAKTFDVADLASAPHQRPPMEPKEIAPGLYQGDLPSALSPARAKANMVTAEIFDRLADNADLASGDRFHVKYDGHTFSRLDTFLAALAKDGHVIEARVEHRVANFADLKTRAPDGTWLDVPAALLVKTGVKNAAGEEAMIPTVHSELVISIRPGPNTKGPGIEADVKWYQGISGTGFFPCDLAKTPKWCGGTVSDVFTGAQALEAIELAGLFSDVINQAASEQKLAIGGYGATGVCNDSVAIVQHAMTGKAAAYPLLMRDETLAGVLKARVSDKDHRDDPLYLRLSKSVASVPSDAVANDTAQARALASLPWVEGQEPFESVVRAREILSP